ncbi:kinase-like protein [Gigaspora margarita]|uniref:Kinase-like protein n=1 Tax=Gigaspora margarita TaxID=4874 RepID=A0A8H3WZX7_GIGMA|nr:kinase-like protein [Gigaspora margarita]
MVEEVRGFNAEELNEFLKGRLNGIDNHINTLTAQEVEGADFLALKYELFVSPPLNIPVGPAVKLDISSSTSSMSTSPLSMFIKTVVDNSEITKKNSETMKENSKTMKENSETIVQFMKEFSRTEHETVSITQAKAYQSTWFESVDVEYFLTKNNSYLGSFQQSGSVNTYLRRNKIPTDTEDNVQEWFNGLMKSLPNFSKRKIAIRDTHTNTYLRGHKPDISVFMEDDIINDVYLTMHVQTLLEVKKRKSFSNLLDEDKGQVLNYIRILIRQQPLRELFAVFLSDRFYFYVMAYDRRTKRYSEHTANFNTGLRLFWVLINYSSPFTTMVGPKSIDFKPSQGDLARIRLKEYLGVGSSSSVYEIDWENTSSAIKVFNSGYDPQNEVKALQYLNNGNFPNVPTYIAHDESSIIICPVCERFGNRFKVPHALQLLKLLELIHSKQIYHRDVRPENILLDTDNNRLVLVDWGSAIKITDRNQLYTYEGTITFASPNILNEDFGPYVPSASDDLHSFMRTMYILRNQSKMPAIPRGDLSSKARGIKEYWNDTLKGPLWAEMVNAVMDKNYDLLTKCCYIFTE